MMKIDPLTRRGLPEGQASPGRGELNRARSGNLPVAGLRPAI